MTKKWYSKHQNTSPNQNCIKKSNSDCLMVDMNSHPRQSFQSWQNYHSREVFPENQQKAPRTKTFMSNIG